MFSSTFLFCDHLTGERASWLAAVIGAAVGRCPAGDPGHVNIFLTGDALFSLVDARARPAWAALSGLPSVQVIADADELRLQGLSLPGSTGTPGARVTGTGDRGSFWEELVSTLEREWGGTKTAAFLLCSSPYMSRVPVYMLRFLAQAVEAGLHPELYCYLDGVHTLHDGQRPSEFENIGRGVSALVETAVHSCRDPWFAACSRCATARGYYQMNPGTGLCEPASCIQDIAIRNLKEILARFPDRHPVASHASGESVPTGNEKEGAPQLVVFITNPPYGTEWTFGGISLAIAAAAEGIPTRVVFIEDGVYALYGTHEVPENDRIFNIQEMIEATTDIDGLSYFVHAPSLDDRGIDRKGGFPAAKRVTNEELSSIIFSAKDGSTPAPAMRVLFF